MSEPSPKTPAESIDASWTPPALAAIAVAILVGCASPTYYPKIATIGEFRDTEKLVAEAAGMSNADAANVKVFFGKYPEGVSFQESKIIVDPARFDLIGDVEARYNKTFASSLDWWIYDYREGERWRTGYCAWQVPFGWATLGLWAILPIHYPCAVSEGSEDDRRAEIVRTLQKATKALGGDVVIITHFGRLPFPEGPDDGTGSMRATIGTGYALRTKVISP